jgi:hypothetical protein
MGSGAGGQGRACGFTNMLHFFSKLPGLPDTELRKINLLL